MHRWTTPELIAASFGVALAIVLVVDLSTGYAAHVSANT